MAVIKGVKEKLHLPLYDSIFVKASEQFGNSQTSNILRFFQDVTGKTKLQTNMQAASLLPHWNTFEARSMRVVISDLAAEFPDDLTVDIPDVQARDDSATPALTTLTLQGLTIKTFVEFKRRLAPPDILNFELSLDDLVCFNLTTTDSDPDPLSEGTVIIISQRDLEIAQAEFGLRCPPDEQVFPHDGYGDVIGKFIYNTVTTFFVGEKIMIQVPTWFFPAGAGPYSEDGRVTTHGYPNPEATFRFAEPISIDTQQNFRVEIEVPENKVLNNIQKIYGPLSIWVVVDGYMTRDVQ